MRSFFVAVTSALFVVLVVWAGCSTPAESPPDAAPPPVDAAPPPPVVDAAPPPPPFAPDTRSLVLKRSIAVRMAPSEHAERYGTIAAGTRVGWKRVLEAEGCRTRWVEIEPYGWVCESYLEPSERWPHGVELPRLQDDAIVPGVFGKVTGEKPRAFELQGEAMVVSRSLEGSMMVRRYGETTVGNVNYWRITQRGKREYLPRQSVREYRPSTFAGVRLGDDTGRTLPMGFPLSREKVSASVPVYSAATGGKVMGKVKGREPLAVLEIARDDSGRDVAYRVGEGRWVQARDMRVARKTAPPPLTGATERWLDLDLDEQVLVAYEGELPVYASLVSTGSRKHPTETGIYRMWVKFAETDMSDLAGEDPYSVATVPWTQFYAKDLALHTAYWHDTFGTRRSHGCANLSPMDARFLYFWSEPEVPRGWSMAKGTVERPGSLVRIRSSEDPEPELRGYAVRVYESRLARQQKTR
jgi:lipoprotein-anchoring transpeptidase ErfK/SrfK